MKNNDFKDIRDITYSREMYEAKPKIFVSAFIYIVLFIIIISLIWAYFSEIDIIARGSGIVRPNENISTVRVESAGKLEQVNVYEGKEVNKGDILYIIDHKTFELQKNELEEKLSDLEQKLKSLNEYKIAVKSGNVIFSDTSEYADYYKTKYDNYKSNLDYLEYQKKSNKLNLAKSNQTDDISTSLENLRIEYKCMIELKSSIEQGNNLTTDTLYSNKFKNYNDNILRLENEVKYSEDNLDKLSILYDAGIISKREYEDAKYDVDNKQMNFDEYKTSYITKLEENINDVMSKIEQLEVSLNGARVTGALLENEEENAESVTKKYKLDTLLSISEEIETCKNSIDNYKLNLKDINIKIDETIIKAPIAGKVNILRDVGAGEYISSQTELLTIIPENEAGYIIDIALANREIAGLKTGDKVKFKFSALPFKEYGEFSGKISQISTDAKIDKMGNSYYLAKANLDEIVAVSYKGEKRNIKVGMTCEAHIIKEEKKVLYWLLEKINLKD